MQAADRNRHASSFGAAAKEYAEHRPDYAEAALRWALELAPGSRVLDLGAGTGKLTSSLLVMGLDVIAVEPDPAMLAELRRTLPHVDARMGSAETIPCADASIDAAVAGNARHWFDMDVAGPELARVLAPGGVLAGLWNVFDDRVSWVRELERVAGPEAIGARDTGRSWRAATVGTVRASRATKDYFGPATQEAFPHGQLRSAQSLVATLGTKAGLLVMPPVDRAVRLTQIAAFLDDRLETAHGEFSLPMVTGVLRVERLSQPQDRPPAS